MIRGIAIFGLNGGEKSTLTHALAKQTGYFEMDAEHLGKLPFSNPRTKSEVQAAIKEDIKAHTKFILTGVTMNWSDEILSHIDIAFWVLAPLEERLKRIRTREEKRFGARVLAGGDMYTQQAEFRKVVENRDSKSVEESAKKLSCPVIVLDGALPVAKNLEKILEEVFR